MVTVIDMPYVMQVDALYFQAREMGSSYAVVDKGNKNRIESPDFSMRFGFKAAIGMLLNHDFWSLWLQYLHFHARSQDEIENRSLFPTWTHPLRENGGFAQDATNHWRLHLGFIDFDLAKSWSTSRFLTLTPYFGLRYAEVPHKSSILYERGGLFPNFEEEISMKNKFWGWGPQAGIFALWDLSAGLGVYARGAVSLPFGYLYIHQDEQRAKTKKEDRLKLFNTYWQSRVIAEAAFGLNYCLFVESLCFQMELHLGWEIYYLFAQNQHLRFLCAHNPGIFITNLGDLMFHGLDVGLSFNF